MKASPASVGRRSGRGWLVRLLGRRRTASPIQARPWANLLDGIRHRAAEQQVRAERWQKLTDQQLDLTIRLHTLVGTQRALADRWSAAGADDLATAAESIESNLRATLKRLMRLEIAAIDEIAAAIGAANLELAPLRALTLQADAERWQGLAEQQLDLAICVRSLVSRQRRLVDLWAAAGASDLAADAEAVGSSLRATSKRLLQLESAAVEKIMKAVESARFKR